MRCLLVVVALASSACAASPLTVVHQAPSNPIRGAAEFAVLPVEGPVEGTDPASLDEGRVCDTFAAYLRAKARSSSLFVHRDVGTADFLIRPRIERLDPGGASLLRARASRIVMRVDIERRDGTVVDVVRVESSTRADPGRDAEELLDRDLRKISRALADYLGERSATDPDPQGPRS